MATNYLDAARPYEHDDYREALMLALEYALEPKCNAPRDVLLERLCKVSRALCYELSLLKAED